MGAVADAVLAAGGEVIGVITEQLVGAEIAHPALTALEVVDSMHERKARMAELADGFIALPGGFGTLDEVLEMLTWNQLGLIAKPVVFLDVDGYFAGAVRLLRPRRRGQLHPRRPPDAGPAGPHRRRGRRHRHRPDAGDAAQVDRPRWRLSRRVARPRRHRSSTPRSTTLFARPADEGVTLALVVLQHGEIVVERYGAPARPTCSSPTRRRSPPRRR